jgi:hypothetical protein
MTAIHSSQNKGSSRFENPIEHRKVKGLINKNLFNAQQYHPYICHQSRTQNRQEKIYFTGICRQNGIQCSNH